MFVYKYVFNGEVIYVGITKDLESRLSQHGRYGDNIDTEGWEEINQSKIFYVKVANEVMADVVESELIRFYKPKYNKAKKSKWCGLPFIEKELKWREYHLQKEKNKITDIQCFIQKIQSNNKITDILKDINAKMKNYKFELYTETVLSLQEENILKNILLQIDNTKNFEYKITKETKEEYNFLFFIYSFFMDNNNFIFNSLFYLEKDKIKVNKNILLAFNIKDNHKLEIKKDKTKEINYINKACDIVQKSLSLFELTKNLSVVELKILDVYLAKIDINIPDMNIVTISKRELEQILLRKNHFSIKNLLTNLNNLMIKNDIPLFENIKIEKAINGYNIILQCSSVAKPYIFNKSNKYIKYKIKNIMNLKNKYDFILFVYLEQNKFRKKWIVSIDELKEILGCYNKYDTFKEFNRSILQSSIKNVLKIKPFQYNFIKSGKNITHIEFYLKTSV